MRFREALINGLLDNQQPRNKLIFVDKNHQEIHPNTRLSLHLYTPSRIQGQSKRRICYNCRIINREKRIYKPRTTYWECWCCDIPLC